MRPRAEQGLDRGEQGKAARSLGDAPANLAETKRKPTIHQDSMKTKVLFTLLAMAAGSLLAAESGPKGEIIAAAKKLAQQGYSWKTALETGNFSNTSEGKADKDGMVQLTMTFNDNTTQAFLKDKKGAIKLQDQDWQSLEEMNSADNSQRGPGRFMGRMLKRLQVPCGPSRGHRRQDQGDHQRRRCLYRRPDRSRGQVPARLRRRATRRHSAGSLGRQGLGQDSLKDGLLSKYELRLQGTMSFNGEDREMNRTTTVEIRDVGKTTLDVPADAKKKLS